MSELQQNMAACPIWTVANCCSRTEVWTILRNQLIIHNTYIHNTCINNAHIHIYLLHAYVYTHIHIYINNYIQECDKPLARTGRKQATATEDFEFHISYLYFIFMGPCIVRNGNLIYDQQDATYNDLYYY
jgi:hypothetical protein